MKYIIKFFTLAFILLAVNSCTKLEQKNFSSIPPDALGGGAGGVDAVFGDAVGGAYGKLRDFVGNDQWWGVNEACTDECIVPTRGNDWGDGDKWKDLWYHNFRPSNGDFFTSIWEKSYAGVAACNNVMADLNRAGGPYATLGTAPSVITPAQAKAEVRALRAFYYFILMNDFGNVPIITETTTSTNPSNATDPADPNNANNGQRKLVFQFIESELAAALPDLSTKKDNTTYGRVNRWAALALRAKLYMNAQVYTGVPRWLDAQNDCQEVINSGKYGISASFADMFGTKNESNPEIIFQIPFDRVWGKGMKVQMMTLHYNSQGTYRLSASPWNGFCTTGDFFNTFTTGDKRRDVTFLSGPAYYPDGSAVKDRGVPFVYKVTVTAFGDPSGGNRDQGARGIKYYPEAYTSDNMSNDFVFFRLSDIMMMLTEAKLRLGTTDVSFVNQIRERAFGNNSQAITTAQLTLNFLLAERGREFAWEGWRRTDLIRFGRFQDTRPFLPGPDASTKTNIFPIGVNTLNKNTSLKQNPGY
jgi:hypothetical protein